MRPSKVRLLNILGHQVCSRRGVIRRYLCQAGAETQGKQTEHWFHILTTAHNHFVTAKTWRNKLHQDPEAELEVAAGFQAEALQSIVSPLLYHQGGQLPFNFSTWLRYKTPPGTFDCCPAGLVVKISLYESNCCPISHAILLQRVQSHHSLCCAHVVTSFWW